MILMFRATQVYGMGAWGFGVWESVLLVGKSCIGELRSKDYNRDTIPAQELQVISNMQQNYPEPHESTIILCRKPLNRKPL